ncbi:MAG: S41 family peptidase [Oscillospiraceae bacterium]
MYIKKSVLVVCSILLIITTSFLTIGAVNPFGFSNFDDFMKFSYVSKLTADFYYEDIDPAEYMNMALLGMSAAPKDPYTRYFYGEEASAYSEELSGTYHGIGLYIENCTTDNTVRVVSAISGTPAEAAGIVTGDKILKIAGEPITGEQLNEASKKMRGAAGSKISIEVLKVTTGETVTLDVERKEIKQNSVTGTMVTDSIGRLNISQFLEGTSEEFNAAFQDLKTKGMKSLIIDLRNNPGGFLDDAVEISDIFIEKDKTIVYTMDKSKHRENYDATEGAENIPIVILTNGGSASASEVLAGALKDYGKATLVGEKTYGKGIIQSVFPIGDEGMLSVTVAKYYTPNGVCIHGEGLIPDIVVPMAMEKYAKLSTLAPEQDEQLQAAIVQLNKK